MMTKCLPEFMLFAYSTSNCLIVQNYVTLRTNFEGFNVKLAQCKKFDGRETYFLNGRTKLS
jgi:hypothetical protein